MFVCPRCNRPNSKCKHPVSHARPTVEFTSTPANGLGSVYTSTAPTKRYTGREWYVGLPTSKSNSRVEAFVRGLFGPKAAGISTPIVGRGGDLAETIFRQHEGSEMHTDGSEHESKHNPDRQYRDVGMYVSRNPFNCGMTGACGTKEPWRLRKANGRPKTRRFTSIAVLPLRERIDWVPDSGKLTTIMRTRYEVVRMWNLGATLQEIGDATGLSRHQVGRLTDKLLSQQHDARNSAPKPEKPSPLYGKDTRVFGETLTARDTEIN